MSEPNEFGEWRNTGECIATECDSTEGKKEQTWYKWICESEDVCPGGDYERYYCTGKGYYLEEKQVWGYTYKQCCKDTKYGKTCVAGNVGEYVPQHFSTTVSYTLGVEEGDYNICYRDPEDVPTSLLGEFNELFPEEISADETDLECYEKTDKTQLEDCDDATPFACEVEKEIPVDEEEVLGEKDEPKEEVEVVLTETGSGSNTFVYIIQIALTLSTLLSGYFFSKKYIM